VFRLVKRKGLVLLSSSVSHNTRFPLSVVLASEFPKLRWINVELCSLVYIVFLSDFKNCEQILFDRKFRGLILSQQARTESDVNTYHKVESCSSCGIGSGLT